MSNELKPTSVPPAPPSKIDVLGKKFKISEMAPSQEPDSDGLMDLAHQTVWYRKYGSISYMQDTVLHELFHSIDEMLVLGLKEKQVHQLAAAFLAVIKHNPELIKWLSLEDNH